jgi:hypothetical protein
MLELPPGARVGTRLALDWGAAGWRTGVCVEVSTELAARSKRCLEIFKVTYDTCAPGLAKSCWHGKETEDASDVRLAGEEDETAEVIAAVWEPLTLRCQLSLARLTEPAKG